MNRFERHHRDSILFGYSCFDRILLNGSVLPFAHTERAASIRWFLREHRNIEHLSRAAFGKISLEYHDWVGQRALHAGIDILRPEKDTRREELVAPYYRQLGDRPGIAVILRARESERVAWHYAKTDRIEVLRRHVDLYYFYLNDPQCGRMFVKICPYFPFNITVWLNGHHWLACQLKKENIDFRMRDNLFVACARPERLQELADAFAPADIVPTVESWVARLLPFFSDAERQQGFRHALFMAQMEYCHNLIFSKRASLDKLFDRLMDANRGIGHPDKLAIIFGRQNYRPDTRTGEIVLAVTKSRLPVLRSSYQQTILKQYVKDGAGLRTESSTYQLKNLGIKKNIANMPKVREIMNNANQRYLNVQPDVLSSYVDRGQLEQLRQSSVSPTGRRVPGLRIDDPRLMAVLQAMLCFAYLVGKGVFRTNDLLADVQRVLGKPDYTLSQLRYDLSKLRGKGLVTRRMGTQCYQVSSEGYRIGIFHLTLYKHVYAPLTAGILEPLAEDNQLLTSRQATLDRLYVAVDKAIQNLATHFGMAA